MIERRIGLDTVRQKFVDQPVVEIQPLGIGRAGAVRKNARPGDGKPVRLDAERLDQLNVLLVAIIVLIGAVAVAVVGDLAGGMGKGVPDRGAAAVFVDRTLDPLYYLTPNDWADVAASRVVVDIDDAGNHGQFTFAPGLPHRQRVPGS